MAVRAKDVCEDTAALIRLTALLQILSDSFKPSKLALIDVDQPSVA